MVCLSELKALVSTGPLIIKEEQHEEGELSLSNSFNTTSQVGSSTGTTQIVPGTLQTSMERGQIVASATVSDNSKKVPYSSPWLSQPVVSDSVMVISQDPGSALSLLPGLLVGVSDPVLEMVTDIPQQKNTAKLVGKYLSSNGVPTAKLHQTTSEMHQEAHDWKSLIPDRVSKDYVADSPGLSDWDLGSDTVLEEFLSTEEEMRGDVFINDKWLQHDDLSDNKMHMDALKSPLLEKLPEKTQEKSNEIMVLEHTGKVVKKLKGDEFGKPGYMKKMKLTFSQASDGSSSLSYEEERSPSRGEQEVEKSKLEMEWRKVEEEGSSKKLEKDLLRSLLALVR